MTSSEFKRLCTECVKIMRDRSPYKTGNLRYNAVKFDMPDNNTFRIYIDEKIAPYMPYTNEEWINRSGDNPNEGWFDEAVKEIAEFIAAQTGGELLS